MRGAGPRGGGLEGLLQQLRERRVLILGLGREGRSTLALLRRHLPDTHVAAADRQHLTGAAAVPLEELPAERIHLGEGYLDALGAHDCIVRSPGISLPATLREAHRESLTSQTELFLHHAPGTVVGITGTKGKSTTASLLHHMLQLAGRDTCLLGNIGVPPLDRLAELTAGSIAVCELSSHQLQDCRVSPPVAIVLNLYPEHHDYYESFEAYVDAKLTIARHQRPGDSLIYNADEAALADRLEDLPTAATRLPFTVRGPGSRSAPAGPLQGRHNLANILAATLACRVLEVPASAVQEGIRTVQPLPHRVQPLGLHAGIRWYDDSASTIPEATVAALEQLAPVTTLICGGYDRGVKQDPLVVAVGQVGHVITLPETGPTIARALRQGPFHGAVHEVTDLAAAVTRALEITPAGAVCLFSPAAASYHAFRDFVARGQEFQRLVRSLVG